MLVRTPRHNPTESLLGYVLRISETNGYDTPWHVLAHAGFSQGEMRSAGFSVEKLSAILGQSADALDEIAYSGTDETGTREFRLLRHSLGKGLNSAPLRLAKPSICPRCIAENGYIDAFFDLSIAVACPVHRCKLTSHCPSCGQQLSWFRPGLLTCRCGKTLAEAQAESVSTELADLMTLIWAILHRIPLDSIQHGTSFPVSQLVGTPLRALTLKLPTLGEFQFRSTGSEINSSSSLGLLEGAALVLANWPKGFHQLLERLARVNAGPVATTFGKRYEHFSRTFFSTRPCGADFVWLRDEFVRYGLESWNESAIDKKMIRGEQLQARYLTISAMARQLNVSRTTLLAWADQGRIQITKVQRANQTRHIADARNEDLHTPLAAEGSVFGKRGAAAYLGLPVSVLDRLKSTGHFAVRHRAKQKQAFHQADLDGFREQLLALAPLRDLETIDIPQTEMVNLAVILRKYRFHDHNRKADFVVAFLCGEINAVCRTGGILDDIHFVRSDVEAFVSDSRSRAAANSLSQQEAAKLIGCEFVALSALLKNGHLDGEKGREGLRITRASINQFREHYAAISSLAHRFDTSAARLLRLCTIGEIPLLQAPRTAGSPISFVKQEDVAALQRLNHENPARKSKGGSSSRKSTVVDGRQVVPENSKVL